MSAFLAAFRDSLRSGRFVTAERLRLIPAGFLIASLAAIFYLGVTAHGVMDAQHRPLGTDFSNVYAAGRFVHEGKPTAPFDPVRQELQERRIFGAGTPFYGWHYPPYFLLIAAPLARLPYVPALILWQLTSFAFYLGALALLLRGTGANTGAIPGKAGPGFPSGIATGQGIEARHWLLLAVAFPAVFVNFGHGHNGFLTAGLMSLALASLDRRPLLAGLCFGLLVYKPQFGVMIPLVLAATARWRTFAAASATVAALTALVTVLFGPEIWPAFLASTHFTRTVVLEQGQTGFFKIQSIFAMVRLWGGPVALAYAVQGAATIAVAVSLARLWRTDASAARKGAALCLAAILATPYSLDYDLMVLAPAIALLAADGMANGFAPWRKSILAALWLAPAVARVFAQHTALPLGVFAMVAGFVLVVRGEDRREPAAYAAPLPGI